MPLFQHLALWIGVLGGTFGASRQSGKIRLEDGDFLLLENGDFLLLEG